MVQHNGRGTFGILKRTKMNYIKHIALLTWIVMIATSLIYLYGTNQWEYTRPTTLPSAHRSIHKGAIISVEKRLAGVSGQSVFLHFFNPECPCSRFNVASVRTLAGKYRNKMEFIVVIPSFKKNLDLAGIGAQFGGLRVVQDTQLAMMCGVYTTPQAVILDGQHRLYYRGNYNHSKYCTDKSPNYAEIALGSFFGQYAKPQFNRFALASFGCQLPRSIN